MATGNLGCVLVTVDGSEESMNALKWAITNLKLRPSSTSSESQVQEEGFFLILHVQSPPNIITGLNPGSIPFGGPGNYEVPAFAQAVEAHQRRISDAIISHAVEICTEKEVKHKTQVVVGDPKQVICDVAENQHVDLLVMGCRPFGPIKRMFLGSVSNYCTNNAQCPVIVVKNFP
ncbi:universal stress protein PHOS34-like [Papaver somniferum]|uniref:universal stress protein PHOS34-like n=1 Tax=Papaver somniferum TaxID=3469 RepID=UPI000E7054A5|nr:universal stress protein PHOS34-like [Papaver somniferum]XP_026388710.1 universal stress protein PHOS34-like [Papaver somniferum]